MPLYEYLCKTCGHDFERIQKFSDPMVRKCPSCGAEAVEQVLSAPAVQFKGSGWYVTDYAKRHSSPATASANHNKSEGASGSNGSSTESTVATKTETKASSESK